MWGLCAAPLGLKNKLKQAKNNLVKNMRKLISLLSASCLALALSALPAKAGCTTINDATPYGPVDGQVCLAHNNLSFNGTVTNLAGQVYTVVAHGTVSGKAPKVTLDGTVTVSQDGTVIAHVTINDTATTKIGAAEKSLEKLLKKVPQL